MADLLQEALTHAEAIVRNVPPAQASAPTGCDWDVAGLLNHMVAGNRYFAASARGEQADLATFEADNVGDDAAGAYQQSAAEAAEAWGRPGALDGALPSGMPAQFLWGIHFVEVLGHGWDLADATGQPRHIPDHLVETAMDIARQMPAEHVRTPAVFGPEVEPAPDASPADRLAAFLGRTPRAATSN